MQARDTDWHHAVIQYHLVSGYQASQCQVVLVTKGQSKKWQHIEVSDLATSAHRLKFALQLPV